MPFIVFEGIDGAGKTTQAKILVKNLKKDRKKVIYTFEPTNGKIGKLLRNYYLKPRINFKLVDFFLFVADRSEHLQKEIKKYLSKGYYVICDRYHLSTLAYQLVQGVNKKIMLQVNDYISSFFNVKPTITFLLDVNCNIAIRRSKDKGKIKYEKLSFLRKVRRNYLYFYRILKEKENIVLINGNRDIESISKEIYSYVKNL